MLGIFLDCKSWLGSCTSQYPFTLAAKKVQWFARKGVQLYLLIRVPSTVLNDLLRDPDSWPLHLFEKVRYLVECESYQTSDKGFEKSLVNLYLFLPKPGREPFWPVFEWLGEYNEPLLVPNDPNAAPLKNRWKCHLRLLLPTAKRGKDIKLSPASNFNISTIVITIVTILTG